MDLGISSIGGLIVFGLGIWAIVSIINSSATTGSKAIWIILVLVLPVIGFLVWFFAGPRPAR
ncbi:MAG: PLD nuclease N-terminal domain-containing protein [Pseudomonadota bacterium]